MSITKRTWRTKDGTHEKWVVRYSTLDRDEHGQRKRHLRTFDKRRDADAYAAQVKTEIQKGMHVPSSESITVREAGENWLTYVKGEQREPTTVRLRTASAPLHQPPNRRH